jgi:hypothetical protein
MGTPERWLDILERVGTGRLSPKRALEALGDLPFADLGFARVDHHRGLRNGFPEVVFCQGKTPRQACAIVAELLAKGDTVLATRVDKAVIGAFSKRFGKWMEVRERTVLFRKGPARPGEGLVLVVCAGTSDLPVATEALATAEGLGARTSLLSDVGVAGIHRLLAERKRLDEANVLVVVAGMEGALPSVVGGLTRKPIIAVPTSIGYGASFGGLTALLAMLNSCAAGVTVVNIDNGFGAGFAAAKINGLICRGEKA